MSARFYYRAEWTCDRCGANTTIDAHAQSDLPAGWRAIPAKQDHGAICPPCVVMADELYARHRSEDATFWGTAAP